MANPITKRDAKLLSIPISRRESRFALRWHSKIPHTRSDPDRIRDKTTNASNHVQRESLFRRQCDIAAGLHHDPAARSDRTRRADRDSLLRHLPLRPPLSPQRVERRSCPRSTRSCRATRSSAGSRRSGSAVTKFKPGDLVGVGCLVDSDRTCPQLQSGPRAVLPEHDAHLQLAGQAPRRRHLRRLLRQHRRGRALRPARPVQPRISPGPRRCSAPGSRPTRRCATGA